jgi:hypothetical protein
MVSRLDNLDKKIEKQTEKLRKRKLQLQELSTRLLNMQSRLDLLESRKTVSPRKSPRKSSALLNIYKKRIP